MGPYQMWDALSIDTVRDALAEADIAVPDWVANVPSDGFYREGESGPEVWTPGTGQYEADPRPADEWGLTYIKEDASTTLWKNGDAALLDVGDGVALFEFRSKSNSLGQEVITGVLEAIDKVETDRDLRGMVIGNEGGNFLGWREPRRGGDGCDDGPGLGPRAVHQARSRMPSSRSATRPSRLWSPRTSACSAAAAR